MYRKILLTALCAGLFSAFSLGLPASARATFITSNGNFYVKDTDAPDTGGPPLNDIHTLGFSAGFIFTNQVNGTAFSTGSVVRSIGVLPLGNMIDGATWQPIRLPDGSSIIVMVAVEGSIIGTDILGRPIASFTGGRAFVASASTGTASGQPTFDPRDPDSWNYLNVFAQYNLEPATDIISGGDLTPPLSSGNFPTTPASAVNISSINSTNNTQGQGVFLFTEGSTAAQNAGITNDPGLKPNNSGDNFLFNVDVHAAFPKILEGLVADIDQTNLGRTISNFDTRGNPGTQTLASSDLNVLNALAALAGFNSSLISGKFATGLGGSGQSDFTPAGFTSPTGDFIASFSGEGYVGYTTPEPSTLILLGVGAIGLAVYGRNRWRRRAQQA